MLDSIFSWWDSSSRSAEPSGSSGINRHARQVNDSLCELHRPEGIPSVQIVLFHGLQKSGDYTDAHWSTWQSEDASCIWPKTWLTEEIPRAHVLSVTYSGGLRQISDGGLDLYLIGENLLSDLLQFQQHTGQASQCPIVLVGHSIGGIVIKQLCCQAHDKLYSSRGTEMRKLETFLKNIKGIFFYSTPHHGSLVAEKLPKNIRSSPLMTYFTALSTDAERLSNKFDNIWKWHYMWWLFAGLGETLRTNLGLFDVFVAPEASTRGENFNLVEGADHFSVCRPRDKSVRSFSKLKDFVIGIADEAAAVVYEKEAHFQDKDNFYIPFGNMHAKVFTAIEKGPLVTLVHGGVGKGKTTLARYVCEYYRKQKEVGSIFDYIHLELCGYGSGPDDALSKMRSVMRSLYPSSVDDSSDKTESGWRSRIASAFHKFLRENRVLIILDNVLDKGFLKKMWEVAQGCPHVKYLVTSQLPNLCHNLSKDTQCIAMRRTTEDEAQKMLATRAGMESGLIPSHLQPIVDEIITATEGNPQALACLVEHFNSSENITDIEAWQDVYNNLPTVLNAVENTVVLGLHHESPRRSLWAAMELCIKSLETSDAKVILFLVYACHRARISEEVLQIWYNSINTSVCTFLKSRSELHSRELLEPHSVETGYKESHLEGEDSDKRLHISTEWCLRPLVKLYMEHHMAGKNDMIMRDEIMDALFGVAKLRVESGTEFGPIETTERSKGEEAKVAVVLCALHFDSSHVDHVVTDIAMRARSASKVEDLDCNWIHRRSEAIEPIVWLLGHPKRKEWAKVVAFSARKVFLTYICERQLDGDGFSTLLKFDAYPPVQLATLRALLSIFTVEETPLPWQYPGHTLKALLALLDSNGTCSTSVQDAVSKAIVSMLEILLRFLGDDNKADLRLQAASALIAVTFGDEKKIVKEDRAVAGVVNSWSQHGKGDLQELLVATVKDLASKESDSSNLAVVNEEGVLAALVKALLEHQNGKLQEVAAEALSSLAYPSNQSIKSKIANEEGAIAGLVMCLSAEDRPDLHLNAAAALLNLILLNHGPTKAAIINEPGCLAALVKLMSKNNNDNVQGCAAGVLEYLPGGGRELDWIRIKILNEDGAIPALVKALSTHNNPNLQKKSTGALANLAWENELLVQAIANDSRAIPGLVKLLSEHNKGDSRLYAIAALANLGMRDDKIRQKIGCEDGALAGLVKCLSEHDKPRMQEYAAGALYNLASAQDNTLKLKIRNENGLLTALVSLSQHTNPSLQKYVKLALENLGR